MRCGRQLEFAFTKAKCGTDVEVPQNAPSDTAQLSQSPWDARAAQLRTSDTIPQEGVSNPRSEAPRGPSQETGMSRRFSVDPERGTDHKKLDLDMKPEGFAAWRDRALGFLAAECPDTRKLLIWSESQNPTIGARQLPVQESMETFVTSVTQFFESLNMVIDSL